MRIHKIERGTYLESMVFYQYGTMTRMSLQCRSESAREPRPSFAPPATNDA